MRANDGRLAAWKVTQTKKKQKLVRERHACHDWRAGQSASHKKKKKKKKKKKYPSALVASALRLAAVAAVEARALAADGVDRVPAEAATGSRTELDDAITARTVEGAAAVLALFLPNKPPRTKAIVTSCVFFPPLLSFSGA